MMPISGDPEMATNVRPGDRELLPTNVRPHHYELELEPSLQTFKAYGTVTIQLEVVEDSSSITLHSENIEILESKIIYADGQVKPIEGIQYDKEKNMTTFQLKDKISSGSHVALSIKFESQVNEANAGLCWKEYSENGTKKKLVCSQMQPIDARKAFPCFDEPDLKATFDVSMIADSKLTALTNAAVASTEEIPGGKTKTTFIRTPRMSTYLTAFVVGELDYVESTDFRIPLRVYAIPSRLSSAKFALDFTIKVLEFYEDRFQIQFPLSKLDQVALPGFKGGMENWGLVLYDAGALLLEDDASANQKQRVSSIIAHELGHQWFGDIVTMKFWDSLWLNEGFATWASYICCDHIFPEWKTWQSFLTAVYGNALDKDSLKGTHAIEIPIMKGSLINQIFDDITYNKGCSVIRMIAETIGIENFFRGISSYLNKYAYSNTVTTDLWDELSKASDLDVQKVMSTWTTKPGYPLVTVTELEDGIHIEQARFVKDGSSIGDTVYPINLSINLGKSAQKIMFDSPTAFIPLKDMQFFKLNAGQYGVYRTLYSSERFRKLGLSMKNEIIPVEDRIGILNDAIALSFSGHLTTSVLLDLLHGLRTEREPVVWTTLVTGLSNLSEAWKFQGASEGLAKLNKSIFGNRAKAVGWYFDKNDNAQLAIHKASVFQKAGLAGQPTICKAANAMFAAYMAGNEAAINNNILTQVFSIAIRYGGKKAFDQALEKLRKTESDELYSNILIGLGATTDPDCIKVLLGLLLTQEVNGRASPAAPTAILMSGPLSPMVWNWLKENWDLASSRIMGLGIGRFLAMVVQSLGTAEHLKDVKTFFFEDVKGNTMKKKFEQQELSIRAGLEDLEAKMAWVERDGKVVTQWLNENGYL